MLHSATVKDATVKYRGTETLQPAGGSLAQAPAGAHCTTASTGSIGSTVIIIIVVVIIGGGSSSRGSW